MTRRPRLVAGLRLATTVSALLGAEAILWWAGGALPSLPADGAGLARTVAEAEPVALAASAIRLVALVVGAGLLVTTALGIAARCLGAVRLVVRLDRWTPPGVRRLLDGALGVGLAASIGLSAVPAGADPGSPPAPASTLRRLPDVSLTTSLRRLPDAPPSPTTGRSPPSVPSGVDPAPTLRRLPDTQPPEPLGPATTSPVAVVPAAGPREVVVQPGDSFWRLAERHETNRLGRTPSEAEVGAYWQELVAVNRSRLAVPEDADLLFPGQVLILPCP